MVLIGFNLLEYDSDIYPEKNNKSKRSPDHRAPSTRLPRTRNVSNDSLTKTSDRASLVQQGQKGDIYAERLEEPSAELRRDHTVHSVLPQRFRHIYLREREKDQVTETFRDVLYNGFGKWSALLQSTDDFGREVSVLVFEGEIGGAVQRTGYDGGAGIVERGIRTLEPFLAQLFQSERLQTGEDVTVSELVVGVCDGCLTRKGNVDDLKELLTVLESVIIF